MSETLGNPTPARDRLDDAVRACVDAGDLPPCLAPNNGSLWLSERRDERDTAAQLCQPCPILEPCAAAAEEGRETFGVWGGRDVAYPPGTSRPAPPKPRLPAPPGPRSGVTCAGCGATFDQTQRTQRYCTRSCRWIAGGRQRRARQKGDTP